MLDNSASERGEAGPLDEDKDILGQTQQRTHAEACGSLGARLRPTLCTCSHAQAHGTCLG